MPQITERSSARLRYPTEADVLILLSLQLVALPDAVTLPRTKRMKRERSLHCGIGRGEDAADDLATLLQSEYGPLVEHCRRLPRCRRPDSALMCRSYVSPA